jgi:hypothetical protein
LLPFFNGDSWINYALFVLQAEAAEIVFLSAMHTKAFSLIKKELKAIGLEF